MEIKNTFAYFGNRQKFQAAIDRTGTDYLPERYNTIVFVEGQGDTPGEIWTHGKQFGGGISESQITNAINNYFNNQENVEDVLPIASYTNKGIVQIQRNGGINVNNGVISANIPEIIAGIKGADGQDGLDGLVKTIWEKIKGTPGENGLKGDPGEDGQDGTTPRIENGYWWIGDVNTQVKASGTEITISDDGYWVLDGTKTNVKATGGNLEGDYVKSVVYNTNSNKLSIVTVSNGVENTEEYEISNEVGNGEPEHYLKAISKTDSGNNINITITKEDDSVESFVIPAPLNSYVVSAEYNASTGNLTINSIENGASKTKTYPISSGENPTGVTAAQLAEILQDYAEKDWVNAQGFLKSDSLSGYAKTSDLSGYASQEWVRNQGFATGTIPTEYIKTASYSSETGDMIIKNNNNTSVVEVHIPDISKGHGIDINNDVISVKESDLNVVKQVSVNPIVQEGEGKTPLATITVDGDAKTIYGYVSTGNGNTPIENPYDDTEIKNKLRDLEGLVNQQGQRMDDLHDWSESDINDMALSAIDTWNGLEGKIGPLWQAGKFDDELSAWAQRNGYVYEDGATWTNLIQRQSGIEASVTSLTEAENGHYEILNGKITTATEDINGLKTAVASMGTEYVKVTDVTEDGIEASKWLGSWFKTATNKDQTLADMFSAAETNGQGYTDRAVATVNQTITTVDNRITLVNTSLGSRLSVVEDDIETINQSGFIANDDLDGAFASMYALSSGAAGTAKAAIIAEARSEANKAVSDITISADKITLDGTTWADTIFSNLISADTILSEVNGTKYLYVKNKINGTDHITLVSSNGIYFEQPNVSTLNEIASGTIDVTNLTREKSRCSKSQLALYNGGKVNDYGWGAMIDAFTTSATDFRMAGSNGAIQITPRSIQISSKSEKMGPDVATPIVTNADNTTAYLSINTNSTDLVINGQNSSGSIYISPSDFYLQNKTTGNYIQWMSNGSTTGGILNVRGAVHASGYATISLAAALARANSLDEEEDETVSTTLGPVSLIFMVTDESKEAAFYCSGDEIGFINKSDLTKSNAGKITSYWAEIDYLNITENHHITSDTQDQDTLVITGHEAVQLGTNSKRDWINIIQNDNIARINSDLHVSDDIHLTHVPGDGFTHISKIESSAKFELISDYDNKIAKIQIDGGQDRIRMFTDALFIGQNTDYLTEITSSEYGTYLYSANGTGFEFDSDVTVMGSISDTSDSTLKDIVSDTTLTVEQIANAPAVNFTWKKDANKENKKELVGTLAQYWQVVLPQVVGEGKDGKLNMQYGNAAMVSSIVTAKEVVALKERIAELERKLNELTSNQ